MEIESSLIKGAQTAQMALEIAKRSCTLYTLIWGALRTGCLRLFLLAQLRFGF